MPAWWHVERGRCGYARYEEWRPASEEPKQRILRTLSGDRYDEAGTHGVETSRGRAYNPITAETVRPRMQRFRAAPDLKPLPELSVPPRTIRP